MITAVLLLVIGAVYCIGLGIGLALAIEAGLTDEQVEDLFVAAGAL